MATRVGPVLTVGRVALLVPLTAGLIWVAGCGSLTHNREEAGALVRGQVVDYAGPLANVSVHVAGTGLKTASNKAGQFELPAVPRGRHRLVLTHNGRSHVYPIIVGRAGQVDLGRIVLGGGAPAGPVEESWAELDPGVKRKLAGLGKLAADAGIGEENWSQFLATGALPDLPDGVLSRRDLIRMVHAAAGTLSDREALAVLAALTGRPASEVRAWLHRMRDQLPRMPEEGVPTAVLARVLTLMQREGDFGDIEAFLLAQAKVPAVTPRADGSVILYDGAQRTLPADQGWWYLALPWPPSVTPEVSDQGVLVDTRQNRAIYAGHFTQDPVTRHLMEHPGMPALDRHDGFALSIDMVLHAEDHGRDDRAGLSILVVCTDLKAIEFGIWSDRIWAQNDTTTPLFEGSRAETAMQRVTGRVAYELIVHGDTYQLYADGIALLGGPLRDYSAWGQFPYTADGLVFVGDDTPSASARYELLRVAVRVGASAGSVGAEWLGRRDAAMLLATATGCHPITALTWLDERGASTVDGFPRYARSMLADIVQAMHAAGVSRKAGRGTRGWVGMGSSGPDIRRTDADPNPHQGDGNKESESVF